MAGNQPPISPLNGVLEQVIAGSPEGFWMLGPDRKTVRVNAALCQLLGFEEKEMLGKSPMEFVDDANREVFRSQMGRIPTSEKRHYRIALRRKDGVNVPVYFHANTLRDEMGALVGSFAFVTDMREQDRRERELEENRSQLRAMLEAVPDMIFRIDREGRYLEFLPSVEGEPYITPDIFIGKRVEEVLPEEAAKKTMEMAEGAFASGETTEFEYLQAERVYECRLSVAGENELVGIVRDVSLKKRAEALLQKERKRFYSLLEELPVYVYLQAADFTVPFSNRKFKEVFGDPAGKTCHQIFQENENPCVPCPMLEVRHCKKAGERERVLPDGRVFQKYEFPFHDLEFGEVVLSVGVDISDRKKMEEEIIRMNRNLIQRVEREVERRMDQQKLLVRQSRMAAMGEMIGAIAHQWKQPLNALGLIVQDLPEAHRFGELDEEYLQQTVRKVMRQVNFMAQTIGDFRNFFRPEKEKSAFHLLPAVAEVLELLGSQLMNYGVQVTLKWKSGEGEGSELFQPGAGERFRERPLLPPVRGFPNEFKQAILNLVNNAKDAIVSRKREWGDGAIAIVLEEGEKEIRMIVEDNGGGIPQELLERIFQPYFTTKIGEDREEEGTGIGLYMARTILEENMDGSITVENGEKGARFLITLPL